MRSVLHEDTLRVAEALLLQDIRQWADYSVAPHPDEGIAKSGEVFSYGEAHRYYRKAAISLVYLGGLELDEQIRLMVTLVVRERP